jgi:hypothetical protein
MHQMWRLSRPCRRTDDGLLLGRTSLIERRDGRFVVRARGKIERLLKCAYDGEPPVDRLMSGLARVASALNANDQCLARIAAVHLQMPDLASAAVRDALAAEDSLIKYARDGGAANWNPALHPRTGAPPNPGWFAPTGGASRDAPRVRVAENDDPTRRSDASSGAVDNWVHLPPAKRIDELGDFLEWLAMPSRRTNRQSARKSIAIGGASAICGPSALSITCSRRCSNPGPLGTNGSKYSSSSTTIPGTIRPKSRNSTISSSICSPCLEPGCLPGLFRSGRRFRPKLSSRQRRDLHSLQSSVPLYGNLGHGREEKHLIKFFAAVRYMSYPEPSTTLSTAT